jgi:general secretion pathway protein A
LPQVAKNDINFIHKYWLLNNPPFDNVPNPALFYPSTTHREGLLRIFYAIKGHKGAAMLTGDIGSGKTTLSRLLIKKLSPENYDVALLNNPNFSRLSFLKELNYQLGIDSSASDRTDLLRNLNERLLKNFEGGKDTVLVVDEAQAIDDIAIFEELRLLLNFQLNNRFLLTLVLLGQPELQRLISQVPQFEQRIAIKYNLKPLGFVETTKYIIYRLKRCNSQAEIFTKEVFKLIHKHTHGIPRLINNLCDLCLLTGYLAEVKVIDSAIVEKIISDGVY